MSEDQKPNLFKRIKIIEDHNDYLIVNKPAGLLSQGGRDEEEGHLLSYLQKQQKQKLHLLTRIDRPVSGLVMLSKLRGFNKHYQSIQEKEKVTKTYIALVEGLVEEKSGTLTHYHYHHKKLRKAILENGPKENYDKIELKYTVLAKLDRYSILSTEILNGRFHQIRSQLAQFGFPIKGDVKYGARRGNKDRSINLHSYKIEFADRSNQRLSFKAKFPKDDSLWNIVSEAIEKNKF
jgi:23S rRNA pseudouridine1911/1915/1917 synthase